LEKSREERGLRFILENSERMRPTERKKEREREGQREKEGDQDTHAFRSEL
jgi:hypothetical protein